MSKPNGTMRHLRYPLNLSLAPSTTTPDEPIDNMTLDWSTTDNDEKVTVTLTLSLNEYVALASCVDVGSDIAYGENAILLWWIWVRSINSMNLCQQIINCIETTPALQEEIALASASLIPFETTLPTETPQMDNRFPPSQRSESTTPPPANCDNDLLWAGILEMVTRLDDMGRDVLQQVVSQADKAERIARYVALVPFLGDIAGEVVIALAEESENLLNAYNAYSTNQVIEDIACDLFCIGMAECRYPTFDEILDYYTNLGINGLDDWANIAYIATVDFLIGSSGLANLVVYFSVCSFNLITLYLGGIILGRRGANWLNIWNLLGEDNPSNDWSLLCTDCNTWCYEFNFTTAEYWEAGGRANPEWTAFKGVDAWENNLSSNEFFCINIELPIGTVITQFQVSDEITGAVSNNQGLVLGDAVHGSDTTIEIFRDNAAAQTHGAQTRTENLSYTMVSGNLQYQLAGTGTQGQTRYAIVRRIRLTGTGTDPMLNGTTCL